MGYHPGQCRPWAIILEEVDHGLSSRDEVDHMSSYLGIQKCGHNVYKIIMNNLYVFYVISKKKQGKYSCIGADTGLWR